MTFLRSRSAVAIYVTASILVAAVIVFFFWLTPKTAKPLEAYLPATTSLAVSVSRDQMFKALPASLERQRTLSLLVEQQRDQWQRLEQLIGRKLTRLIWFADTQGDGFSRGLLFQSEAAVSRGDASQWEDIAWPDNSWVQGPETRIVALSQKYFVVSEIIYETGYYSNNANFLLSAPLALYLNRSATALIDGGDLKELNFLLAAVQQASELRLTVVWTAQRLALRVIHPITEAVPTVNQDLLRLAMPSDYRLGRIGPVGSLASWREPVNVIGSTVESFSQDLSRRYGMTIGQINDLTSQLAALVVADNSWLAASYDRSWLRQEAEQLTAWFHPALATSTLPDGTPYRQYLKQSSSSTVERLDDQDIEAWRGPGDTAVYLVSRGDLSFLSDTKSLLRSQLKASFLSRKTLSSVASLCDSQPEGRLVEIISIKQPKNLYLETGVSRLGATLSEAGDSQIWQYCLEF